MMFVKKSTPAFLALILCIGLIEVPAGQAQQVKKVGTSAAAFLRIPAGARGTAMGSAFVATANDASAMYWNSAGLANLSRISLLVDHSSWLAGLNYNYFALAIPMGDQGTVGINVAALSTEKMLVTTVEQPMGTGATFDASSVAVGVAYARALTNKFSIGANVKFIQERIFNSKAIGFAIDLGTLYVTPFDGIRLGVNISNFGTDLRMDGEDLNIRVDVAPEQEGNNQSVVGRLKTDNFSAPLLMRVGLAWDAFASESQRLTLAIEGLNPNDNAQSVNVGAEYALLNNMLVLRGGLSELFLYGRERNFSLGVGVNFSMQTGVAIAASYSYQDFVHLNSISKFTLEVQF